MDTPVGDYIILIDLGKFHPETFGHYPPPPVYPKMSKQLGVLENKV